MLSLAHTLTSLPLAAYLHNPLLIFALAFLLHLASDSILHWNIDPQRRPYPYQLAALDVLTGLVFALLISYHRLPALPTLAAIAGGNAPDAIQTLWYIFGATKHIRYLSWLKPFFTLHHRIQHETKNITLGLIPQIILITLSLLIILPR